MLGYLDAARFVESLPWWSASVPAPMFTLVQSPQLVTTCCMASHMNSGRYVRIAVRGLSPEAALRFAIESWMVAHEVPEEELVAIRAALRQLEN